MHFIRELIHDGIIDIQYIQTTDQIADLFTKPFTEMKFLHLQSLLGVRSSVAAHILWAI